jgi:hypothetical protein
VSETDLATWSYAREVMARVRRRRSEAKQPLKVPIVRALITDGAERLGMLDAIEADLRSALRIDVVVRSPTSGEPSIEVEFGAA